MDNLKHCKQALLLVCFLFLLSSNLTCAANETTIGSHNTTVCIKRERQALLKFKQGIQVDRCGLLSSWGNHEDDRNCCQWHGVRCSNITGHVIMLNLRGVQADFPDEMCLQGKVGTSLVDLKHLRYLDLSYNDFFAQPIPHSIGSLVNLKYLNLSNTDAFHGEIPAQLGNLSNLVSLGLSSYYLNNSLYVKSLSWLSQLTMLRTISLHGVDLSKATNWLQVLNNLPSLRVLELEYCRLPPLVESQLSYRNASTTLSVLDLAGNDLNHSSIVFGWLFNLSGINSHLTHLDLHYNQLRGPLPSAFGNLQALSYLDLSDNEFQGTIPSSFGNMQSLSYLILSYNQLKGPIPDNISNITPLTYLYLSANNFQSLPKSIGNLCSLHELYLDYNNFTDELSNVIKPLIGCANKSLLSLHLRDNKIKGQIDQESIDFFSSLKELDLNNNQLNGRIPQSLGQLSKMEMLDLSSNSLQGILSNIHLSNLLRLRELMLGNNSGLALNINDDWVPPFQLDVIDLRACRLGPLFPKWLLTQTNYSYLDISNAKISDNIPKSFWDSLPSKLETLNMSHNNIYGKLPNLSQLQLSSFDGSLEVDLSFNNLQGAIPLFPSKTTKLFLNNNKFTNPISFMCPKSKIQVSNLDLSNNFLSRELPNCWINFPRLSILHLENNNFSGVIPSSFGYLDQLQALHLSNNIITGGLPRSLLSLTSLVILDLGRNSLSGHIPSSMGNNLGSLGILNLRGNNFDGKLPLSLCQMSFLQVLDLSSNHLFGTLPKCIYNFTAMQNGTGFMSSGLVYSVSRSIHEYFADAATLTWKRKEWSFRNTLGLVKVIDISNNELEGEIPTEFSFLKDLDSLDLSRNNLIGAIPQELGQLTALQMLDLSRNQFSGEVPITFAKLDSLGILDLSYNHLIGKIPDIPQLQRFDASSYMGNSELCGLPLPKCPWDQPHDNNLTTEDNANHQDEDDNDGTFTVGLYVSVILGFIIGFWGVCGTLVLQRAWRHAFFGFLEDMRDKFSVQFSLNLARLRRRH